MVLMMLPLSRAATNLNSSRSNNYRLVYDSNVVSQAQGDAMAKELDKLGLSDEAKLKMWLPSNFKRFGIDGTRVKEIDVFLEQKISCTASATTCKGKYLVQKPEQVTTVKGSKSNADNRTASACFCLEP